MPLINTCSPNNTYGYAYGVPTQFCCYVQESYSLLLTDSNVILLFQGCGSTREVDH